MLNTSFFGFQKAGWGVKTFSEIMREKQQRKQEEKSAKIKAKITPIVFSQNKTDDQKATKRKFTPIVFEENKTEENVPRTSNVRKKVATNLEVKEQTKKPAAKKFQPIVFDLDSKKAEKSVKRSPSPVTVEKKEDIAPAKPTVVKKRRWSRKSKSIEGWYLLVKYDMDIV